MKIVKLLVLAAVVGIVSALTYFVFVLAVAEGIELIWKEWLDTDNSTYLVLPAAIILGLAYFYSQHRLDKSVECNNKHSSADMPKPTVKNYSIVLIVGFFSLLAGVSLGPEAVLIPACLIVGGVTASKFTKGKEASRLLLAAGLIGLMASFFHSWIIGILSVLFAKKELKLKPSNTLWAVGVVSSFAAYFTLNIVEGKSYLEAPVFYSRFGFLDLLLIPLLFGAGYLLTYALRFMLEKTSGLVNALASKVWWKHALLASVVLGVLYTIGGEFVRFTGNESIKPLLGDASELGILSLLWILLIKLVAIAWSKSAGYRGGLVFPMIFAASVIVALSQSLHSSINQTIALFVVVAGAIYANTKIKILF